MMFDLPDYIEIAGETGSSPRNYFLRKKSPISSAEGTSIPVNVDFRVWMELECALLAQDNHQLQDVLTRILPDEIPDIGMDRILPAVMGFYALRNPYPFPGIGGSAADSGRNRISSEENKVFFSLRTNKNRHERWYDFHVDSGRLAASFRAVYGIDLFRRRNRQFTVVGHQLHSSEENGSWSPTTFFSRGDTTLHWWEFRMLMFHLPPDCEFMRVAGYRLADISELPKSQRKHYQKMKAIYALPEASGLLGRTPISSLEERDRDMLRRMEKIRKEMSENG